jgi:hypothetical protein
MSSQIKRQSDEAFFKPPREFPRRDAKGWPVGPQTKRREKENRKLNASVPDSVKKVCETRIPGVCIGNRALTWSHAWKTRFNTTSALWQKAARSCLPCHQHCEEKMSHKERAAFIEAVIARRKL